MFWTSVPKDLPCDAVYSFLFFLPPVLCCVVCVKSTSNSTGRVLRLIWLLFHCTSPSYTQSTSNTSPVKASKNGTVCFCPSCPFPVPGAGVYVGIFISKHVLDVLIPYGLIFASFWWGPAVSLWRICARSELWKQSLSGRWILRLTGSWHWSGCLKLDGGPQLFAQSDDTPPQLNALGKVLNQTQHCERIHSQWYICYTAQIH